MDSTEDEDEEEEKDEQTSRHAMEVEGNIEVTQTKETYVIPNAQNLQLQWQDEKTMYGEDPMLEEIPMRQEEYAKHLEQVLQTQKKQEKYIDSSKQFSINNTLRR